MKYQEEGFDIPIPGPSIELAHNVPACNIPTCNIQTCHTSKAVAQDSNNDTHDEESANKSNNKH